MSKVDKKIESGALKKWNINKKVGLPCGKGSTLEATEEVRKFIEKVIVDYNIKSIVDAPCGDYLWMNYVDKHGASYKGYDINNKMLEEMRTKYKGVEFYHLDIVNELLPTSDLIICRDCLFHLTTEAGVKALKNFKKTNSKYLMTTTFDTVNKNVNLPENDEYGFRKINIKISPYNLENELIRIYEPRDDRYFGLWKLN